MPHVFGIFGINESAQALNPCGIEGSRAGIRKHHQLAGKPVDAKEGGAPSVQLFGARNTICAGGKESTRWGTQADPPPR